MIIQKLNASQLDAYIQSDAFRVADVIPISRHRALSHVNNPRMEENDILMLLAWTDNKLVGYLGILPDKVSTGKLQRMGWMSCLWVDQEVRGKGIAKQLISAAFESWNGNIMATEFTKEAKALYDKLDVFADLKISKGIRGYLRFNLHKTLPVKYPSLHGARTLLKLVDRVLNLPNAWRLWQWARRINAEGGRIEHINILDKQSVEFIANMNNLEFFRRQEADLNWTLRFPWILSAPFLDEFSNKYHFSSLSKEFSYIALKLYSKDKVLKGFLMLSVRDKNMKVPYAYFEQADSPDVVRAIYYYMLQVRAETLTVFNPWLCKCILENKSPFLYKRNMKRHYLISKTLKNVVETGEVIIQDGDGDCAFT